jgi:UDP-N-acetyl-D-glucosamine dehydrogenase
MCHDTQQVRLWERRDSAEPAARARTPRDLTCPECPEQSQRGHTLVISDPLTIKNALIDGIDRRQSRIGIIGMGYVGLPLVLRFAEAGFNVLGFDISPQKVDLLNQGQSYIEHVSERRLSDALAANRFAATTDFARAAEADALIICVPTPLGIHHEPDISYVVRTIDSLVPHLREGQVISLESTTYPGTTEEEIRLRVEERGLAVGEQVFLVYSPEREDPGNAHFTTRTIPKIVGGTTAACKEVGVALYESVIDCVVPVSSTQVAEMAKLLENIYRAVNIGLVNELKMVADRMGIDIWEVIDAAATKPFGFTPFYPGPGLGGHCIPIDPFYLTWKAREYGVHTRFIELAGEINRGMPAWVLSKTTDALNERGKSLKGANVLVLGIAYKKNVDDARESPSIDLMELLREKGANLSYSDPHVTAFPEMRHHRFDLESVPITPAVLAGADCIVIATDHDDFDYDMIRMHSPLIVDTRGRYRDAFENVIRS